MPKVDRSSGTDPPQLPRYRGACVTYSSTATASRFPTGGGGAFGSESSAPSLHEVCTVVLQWDAMDTTTTTAAPTVASLEAHLAARAAELKAGRRPRYMIVRCDQMQPGDRIKISGRIVESVEVGQVNTTLRFVRPAMSSVGVHTNGKRFGIYRR